MKHISQIINEEKNKSLAALNDIDPQEFKDLTDTSGAIICDDCWHGNHEIAGHPTCECACHGNPQCFVCGRCLLLAEDRREGVHQENCQGLYDEQEANRVPNEPFGRYEWER